MPHHTGPEIARDLGISESCLRNWMARADAGGNGSGPTAGLRLYWARR